MKYDSFTDAYRSLIGRTYLENHHESSPRGMKIRERLFETFTISDPRNRLLYVPERKFSLSYTLAEILWYMLGSDSTEWISNYSGFWSNISDDGETANSAYGARIFKNHRYHLGSAFRYDGSGGWKDARHVPSTWTQWEYVKEELSRDPDSRRAVIHIRMPQDGCLAKLDVPCTLTLQFFNRDGKLHMAVSMRSSDVVLGITYDVPAFTFMQERLAQELGLELGCYHHVSNSLHVYERHYDMCERILADDAYIVPGYGGDVAFETKALRETPIAMPALPKAMPIEALNDIQRRARSCDSSSSLIGLGNEARMLEEPIWVDWAHVLIAHRAKKLGDAELESWFHDGLALECFRRCA